MVALYAILAAISFGTNVPTSIRFGTNQVQTVRYGTNVVWTSDVTDGLVAWWKMDEGAGTTSSDSSGSSNHLSALSNITWVAGKSGYAMRFNGTNSLAVSINNAGEHPTNITISAWILPFSVTADQYIIAKNNSITWRGVILGFQDGNYNVYNSPGYPTGNASQTQIGASTSAWQHVCYTANGTNLAGYINGIRIINVLTVNFASANTNAWRIGQYTSGNPFGGLIDDVRIYNRALTSNEVWSISR